MAQLAAQMEGLQITHPAPATNFRSQTQGACSVYTIKVKPGQVVYRYDVEIVRMDLNKIITRGGSDEGQRSLYRRLCHDIVRNVYDCTHSFGVQDLIYVYDCKKNLFTNQPMNLPRSTIELQPAEISAFSRRFLRDSNVTVQIQRSEAFETDISDVRAALAPDVGAQANRDIRMFLELLTSQQVVNSDQYDVIGMGKIFEKNEQNFQDGIRFRAGLAKGVRIIHNNDNPVPALVADVKKSAFYKEQSLVATAQEFNAQRAIDWRRFMHFYKGVRCYLSYAPSRSVVIAGFTDSSVGRLTITTTDGQQIPLTQFYQDRHQVQIQYPDWPGIRIDASKDAVFPLDVLVVLPNQRIPLQRMTDNLSRELLRLNTVEVHVREANINVQLGKILNEQAVTFMRRFGVVVDLNTNDVKIGVRHAPVIEYGANATVQVTGANWMKESSRLRYIDPTTGILKKWAVVYDARCDNRAVENFARDFVGIARQKGVQVPNPDIFSVNGFGELDNVFKQIKQTTQFVMYIDDIREKSHGVLKLCERKHFVLTQHVTINKAIGGMATKSNILHKFNCKIFGLCYKPKIEPLAKRLELDTKHIFVMGLDVAHPAPASPHQLYSMRQKQINYQSYDPSVVGITANYAKNIHTFAGDYFFQPSRREAIDPAFLQARTKWILAKYVENTKNPPPKVFFILRDGVSEGQIPMCVNDELPAIRQGCLDFNANFKPRFVLIIVSKRHNKRFWAKQGNRTVDTEPGSVVDTKIVRADVKEFYLQSHARLKGTVKIPQYVVPVDEANLSTDELEAFVNYLCHSHQIVSLGVSLPEPVYQAHELAKRGKNNYEELKNTAPNMIPRDPDNPQLLDFDALTARLAYRDHKLVSTRFTA
ncbi:piwi domain-containing protein [Aphelenchoides avenae]|nr:piwi domain-containing protein [Aphelenchus avenae]